MIHIVFNEADVDVLKAAMQLDDSLEGEVKLIRDDYAVGPIADLEMDTGRNYRKEWWAQVLDGTELETNLNIVDDAAVLENIVEQMISNEIEDVWIWAAQNKHDVSGYYAILLSLKQFNGRVFILYMNNLPFINEKGGIFYPTWLYEIPAKEFSKAKKLAREITSSEWEIDPDEWQKLAGENKGVRLLEGGKKLIQKDYDHYDKELDNYVNTNWQKFSKIYSQYSSKAKEITADAFILWRLQTLASQGTYEMQGNIAQIKTLEFKKPGSTVAEAPVE
jgi:hypothetical protein